MTEIIIPENDIIVPESDAWDDSHDILKALIGTVPLLGWIFSEYFSKKYPSPIKERTINFLKQFVKQFVEYKEKNDKKIFDLESIISKEQIVDCTIQTLNSVLETSEKEKLDALRNALLNTVIEPLEVSEQRLFLRLIRDFTVIHLNLLKVANDPKKLMEQSGNPISDGDQGTFYGCIVQKVFPGIDKDLSILFWKELSQYYLVNSSIDGGTTYHGLYQPKTTDLGKKFIKFISEN